MNSTRATSKCVGILLCTLMFFGLPNYDIAQAQSFEGAEGTVTISGGSTLRNWSCEVEEVSLDIQSNPNFKQRLFENNEAAQSLTATIVVPSIECGIGKMNDHLRDALKASNHPNIVFSLGDYSTSVNAAGNVEISTVGELTIAGSTRTTDLNAVATFDSDGTLHVQGEKELLMTDYNVDPPKVLFGTIKVHDRIVIEFHLKTKITN